MNSVAQDIKFHKACLLLPKMSDEEYRALRASIRDGYDKNKPIELYDQQILDGRHRYLACKDEGIPPIFISLVDIDPFDYVRRVHESRRSWINQEQKALVIGELIELSESWAAERQRIQNEANRKRAEAAKERERETTESGKTLFKSQVMPQLEARLETPQPPKPPERTSAAKAKQIGVSRPAVERAETIKRERPDLAEKVKTGEIKPGEALRQIKKDRVSDKVGEIPKGKYRVFYADPPWSYNDKCETGSIQSGGAEKHYPSMTLSELSALPVSDRSHDDAVLFLWVTSPLLPDGLKLASNWGFTYKASFVWDKVKHNMGHYNSVRHEFLLICTRGSCTPDVLKLYDSVQSIERTDTHSQKPEEFRVIIDTIYPDGPRIELFRRGVAPNGWTVWGSDGAEVL